jgi:tetratricopeptide repeat protein
MKKILTFALCLAAAGSLSAQKQVVDQANKLAGKNDKIAEARELIGQAAANPETQNDARTYFVAGKIEYDAFDNSFKKQMINPKDPSVKPLEMGEQLLNGYNQFLKAMSLDSVPNAKGEIKPKFSKDIASKINGHFNDYFNAGGTFYNEKKFYPEAYEAFMIYGNMPKQSFASKEVKSTPDSVVNTAFFNAGISAYAGNNLEAGANAFKHARLNNSDNYQNYVYEIACWQYLAGQDSTKVDKAKSEIMEIAEAGHKKFGISQPLFINNLINSLVLDNQIDKALQEVNTLVAENPDNASLYGLRGYVNDRKGDDEASVADYKKAASLPGVDFETLKNAAKKIFKVGTQKWNNIEGATPEQRNAIKTEYFQYAKDITDKAKGMNADDSDLNYVIENIDYALETFFN